MTSKEYQREWKKNHPKKYKEYKKNWRLKNPKKYKEENKINGRKYYLKNKKEIIEKHKIYNRKINYHKKYKNQIKARNKANQLIIIPKDRLCEICNISPAIEKHHENYDNPLKVKLLCRECHWMIHNKIKL